MLFRRGQRLSRFAVKPNIAGRGLVERMRTTAFALLGVTTAMALGLVALISQQSWHYLPVGPVPSYQAVHGKLDSAIALGPAAAELGLAPGAPIHPVPQGRVTAVAGSSESRLSGSRRVPQSAAASPVPAQPDGAIATPPGPGAVPADRAEQPPASPPAGTPSSPPTNPSPAPGPAPTPSPAPTTPPAAVASGNPGKGHAYGRQKASAPPKPKPSHPAPAATVPAAEPSPSPSAQAAPSAAAPGLPGGPGNGHGHAYGHDK
ncbi:MAG: hypothetical protein WA862_10110 [Solirubrobacterales bacterium]